MRLIRILFALLLLTGCGAPAATPGPIVPTMTLIPPTATVTLVPAVTPTATATPGPVANACKLPEAAFHGDVGLGFPRYPTRMASTGTVRAKVIFVDFSDAPAAETPEQAFSLISPGASDFFRAVSYDRLQLELEPHFVWLRMSKPSAAR